MCPALEPSAQEIHEPVGPDPEGATKNDWMAGVSLIIRTGWMSLGGLPGAVKAPGKSYCGLSILKRSLLERWGQNLLNGPTMTGEGIMILNQSKVASGLI